MQTHRRRLRNRQTNTDRHRQRDRDRETATDRDRHTERKRRVWGSSTVLDWVHDKRTCWDSTNL